MKVFERNITLWLITQKCKLLYKRFLYQCAPLIIRAKVLATVGIKVTPKKKKFFKTTTEKVVKSFLSFEQPGSCTIKLFYGPNDSAYPKVRLIASPATIEQGWKQLTIKML